VVVRVLHAAVVSTTLTARGMPTIVVDESFEICRIVPLEPRADPNERDTAGIRKSPKHTRADPKKLGRGALVKERLRTKQVDFLL